MACLVVKNSYGRELCMTNIIIRLYVAAVNLVLNIVDLVKPVIRRMFKKPVATRIYLVFRDNKGFIRRGKKVSTIIRNDQQVSFALAFQDAHGNPVTELGSVPAWELDNADLATLEVSEDGMSAVVRPTGQVGSVNVFVRVDADPDEDVEELLGQASIAILAGKAKVIQLSGVIADKEEKKTGILRQEDLPEGVTLVSTRCDGRVLFARLKFEFNGKVEIFESPATRNSTACGYTGPEPDTDLAQFIANIHKFVADRTSGEPADAPAEPVPMPDGPGGEAPVVPEQPVPEDPEE